MNQPSRLCEFIEDADGRGSAARLNMIIGVMVGSVVVLAQCFANTLTGDIFGIYMLATGGVYGFGKWRESVERVAATNAGTDGKDNTNATN